MAERKAFLVRMDPELHDALQRWAADELRSLNGQIEFLLRRALVEAGRAPRRAASGGPRASAADEPDTPREPRKRER
jgi:hypothetical protein